MRKVQVLGVGIHAITPTLLTEQILETVRSGYQRVFAYVNVHALNIARSDAEFCDFLNTADITYCDGEGVRFGARLLGASLPPRIVLTYYVWELLELCNREGISIYFLGGQPGVLEKAIARSRGRFPGLRIVGSHHGYFSKDAPGSEPVLRDIGQAAPDVLFVGFGMPAQEEWIRKHRRVLGVKAIVPCGSMIDYVAGTRSVAPAWMAGHGLEWLYRLLQEPGRLWKRYLLGNPLFLMRVIWSRFSTEKS